MQEVIAINQDDLGVAGDLIWVQGSKRVSCWWEAEAQHTCVSIAHGLLAWVQVR